VTEGDKKIKSWRTKELMTEREKKRKVVLEREKDRGNG
jgi:hypothetical protein